jgi:putative ABC transport system substrate-binding protein
MPMIPNYAIGRDVSSFFNRVREKIIKAAESHSLPAINPWSEYVTGGGLLSYGPSLSDGFRQAGVYAGRILKGEKPADLPVLQPVKFELVINLTTAKALGVAIPSSLLARADGLID